MKGIAKKVNEIHNPLKDISEEVGIDLKSENQPGLSADREANERWQQFQLSSSYIEKRIRRTKKFDDALLTY